MSIIVSNLGFPRIGPRRELKFALEQYWSGKIPEEALQQTAEGLRAANWALQKSAGIDHIPSNDFSLYDQVLDTSLMVGAIPDNYGWTGGNAALDTYFAMARGSSANRGDRICGIHGHDHATGLTALEMTKWFDTNYHFMVPELKRNQEFTLASNKPVDEYREASALGYKTRPVLVGPVTYLKLAKSRDENFQPLALLGGLIPVYIEMLRRLKSNGAEWVQIDEPCLALDLDDATRTAFRETYAALAKALPDLKLLLTSYFGGYDDNLDTALSLPVAGLHLDLARAPEQLDTVIARAPKGLVLSLGLIDGRNVWRANLSAILDRIEPVITRRGTDHLMIAPSCSLLHTPVNLQLETELDPELKTWLAFGVQKLGELSLLGRAVNHGRSTVRDELAAADAAAQSRRTSAKIHNGAVQARLAAVTGDMGRRNRDFSARSPLQREHLKLPDFPTTTIGSFPQTGEVRKARAAFIRGELSQARYDALLKRLTREAVRFQEEIGLDVLVHGEFERNDMVQYFGEQLSGYAFTRHGWVQSYGSRCVRPPVIFGDVSRPEPMTVGWATYAQSLTERPVKGMLTGPVTMLFWSFVRDDLPRSQVCSQIALALRDEVSDLEKAGIRIIQIDEPALREGLPLRKGQWQHYLDWAVESFRLCSSGVHDGTQIHTHMCYSEFNDIIASIAGLDADVISIETSRSNMELLEVFNEFRYPNEIGPGVYDIHSPRVPAVAEMTSLLDKARSRLSAGQIWVNPDCGLKTRQWDEVRPALINMVEAARTARSAVG